MVFTVHMLVYCQLVDTMYVLILLMVLLNFSIGKVVVVFWHCPVHTLTKGFLNSAMIGSSPSKCHFHYSVTQIRLSLLQ